MEIKLTINGDDMQITKIETENTENAYAAESPLTDWAREEAAKEMRYLAFLSDLKDRLHTIQMDTHEYMSTELGSNTGVHEWSELYIVTRQVHALNDMLAVFQKHTYPPF